MSKQIFAGIDIETTGIDHPTHRIIEVYIGLWSYENGNVVSLGALNQRINPMRGIALEAQRVHKITANDLIGKPIFQDVAGDIVALLALADAYVWHNGNDFDGPFLNFEITEAKLTMPVRPAVDTMVEGVWATFDGKKPNLRELCLACDVPYDPALAHAAEYDVRQMMSCFFKGMEWGFYRSPVMEISVAA